MFGNKRQRNLSQSVMQIIDTVTEEPVLIADDGQQLLRAHSKVTNCENKATNTTVHSVSTCDEAYNNLSQDGEGDRRMAESEPTDIIREYMRAPPMKAPDMDIEIDTSNTDAEDTIHQSNTVSGRKRIHSPIQENDFAATNIRRLNNHDSDDLIGVTSNHGDHLQTNITQIMEPELSISIWERALCELPNNWERGLLLAMRDISEDITSQQLQPQAHQQVLPDTQPDLQVAKQDVNNVQRRIETNDSVNSIHNTTNTIHTTNDNVNSDNDSENNSISIEYEQNVDIDNDHMIGDVHKIRRGSRGGSKKQKSEIRRRRDRKQRNKVGI